MPCKCTSSVLRSAAMLRSLKPENEGMNVPLLRHMLLPSQPPSSRCRQPVKVLPQLPPQPLQFCTLGGCDRSRLIRVGRQPRKCLQLLLHRLQLGGDAGVLAAPCLQMHLAELHGEGQEEWG